MKTLLLIDANSIIHRCFHALPPLTAPDGRATQVLYGVSNMLLKLLGEGRPEYAAACFDRPEPTFRKEAYAAYKAQRPKAPDELVSQIIEAHQLFEEFGIKTVEKAGFEADDVIATLATKFGGGSDVRVVILTGDLDTLQVVSSGRIVVRTFRKGLSDTVVYDEEKVRERYGLSPAQLTDYKALVGDKSDNVPGVPGVGEKTASALLQTYGTLEKLLASSSRDAKLKGKLLPFANQIASSKFLVTLKRDVPLPLESPDDLAFSFRDGESLKKYFSSLGFETLLKRLAEGPSRKKEKAAGPKRASGALFPEAEAPGARKEPALPRGEAKNIAVVGEGGTPLPEEELSRKKKIGFALKEYSKKLLAAGRPGLSPPYADLGVMFWLLDPDFKAYEPEVLARVYLGKTWEGTDEDYLALYAFAKRRLEECGMTKLFEETEMPLLSVLADMETWGVGVSGAALKKIEKEIAAKLQKFTAAVYASVKEEFNLNSPQQLAGVLYGKLGLKQKKGSKVSTSAERLEELREAHPAVPLVLEYRENFKIQSTYVKPLQALRDKRGRVHTQFVQTGTGTGRLSSKEPNLQNIPQESAWAKPLREAFVAEEGWEFASFDYSQLELRILAGLSGDENMRRAFHEGVDIHRLTAAKVFGIPEEKVGRRERRIAKTLNFGLMYGMGSSAFAAAAGVSRAQAQEFIKTYFKNFSGVAAWQEKIRREAHEKGYVETLTGRRRYFPAIASGNGRAVAESERAAVNHPVQGLGADFIKLAMIRAASQFRSQGLWGSAARLVLTIHDELLFEARRDMMKKIIPAVQRIMQEVFPSFPVPLTVEVSAGATWGALEKIA